MMVRGKLKEGIFDIVSSRRMTNAFLLGKLFVLARFDRESMPNGYTHAFHLRFPNDFAFCLIF